MRIAIPTNLLMRNSANEIAAATGHKTLKEVGRYTRTADQKRLAAAAVARNKKRLKCPNPNPGVGKSPKKINECEGGAPGRYDKIIEIQWLIAPNPQQSAIDTQ